jgi:hypothetical protein
VKVLAAPVVRAVSCSLYWLAPTCTALAMTPALLLLMAPATAVNEPSPTSVMFTPFTVMGPVATTAVVAPT